MESVRVKSPDEKGVPSAPASSVVSDVRSSQHAGLLELDGGHR